MPDLPISGLPAATTPLAGTEIVPVVQSGTTDRVTVANLTAGRAVAGLSFTSTGGTVTASAPIFNGTQTWNNAGTTFTGALVNVTDTASASGSLLLDLQVGGSSRAYIRKDGLLTTAGDIRSLTAVRALADSAVVTLGASNDVILARDAANTLALRNGTNAQIFRAYRTYTDPSNYELGVFGWGGTSFYIGTQNIGTGAARPLHIQTGGADRWIINTSGHLTAATDNTYDIGASGANRPRTAYLGTGLNVAATGSVAFDTRAVITSPADGNIRVSNAANTNSYSIGLGGSGAAQFSGTVTATSFQLSSGNTFQFDSGVSNNYFIRKNSTTLQLNNVSTGVFEFFGSSSNSFTVTTGATNTATFNGPVVATNLTASSGNVVATGAVFAGSYVSIADGMTAPSAQAGQGRIYIDTADGDLKIIFGDGTIKTIVTDT